MFSLIKKYLKDKKEEREFYAKIKQEMEKIRIGLPAFSNNNFPDSTFIDDDLFYNCNKYFGGL